MIMYIQTNPRVCKKVKIDKVIYNFIHWHPVKLTLFRRARNCAKVLEDLVAVGN